MEAAKALTRGQMREHLAERSLEHVVVLGANGTMGYGSGALFTRAVPRVTFLARSKEKAEAGLAAAVSQVRSSSVASRVQTGSYDELETALRDADLVFEALTEDFALKKQIFDRVEKARVPGSLVATVTSGLSINELAEGRGEDFQRCFMGLHFFNPPNVIVGTELIAGAGTDPELVDFVEAFARLELGREIVRTSDTPAFAGNRVGFKLLNEAAILAETHGPVLVDRLVGPYTGRSMPPLATIDLVGFDIHRAIVDGIHQKTHDEAHETLKMPAYLERLIERGVLGDKSGGGFFKRDGKQRLALDIATGDWRPVEEFPLPDDLGFIDEVAALHAQGRYAEGMARFLDAEGESAATARRVIAGYISYAFHRVGEVTPELSGIDRIMASGFNWAPPGALVDVFGTAATVNMLEQAGVPVPPLLLEAAERGAGERFFTGANQNIGRFFVAA